MFSIREAKIEDRFIINKLAFRIWPKTYGHILSEEQLNYMFDMMYHPDNLLKQMTEQGHQYFIVSVNQVDSGYLSIEQTDKDSYIFQKIYALPESQGTGLGRYIIEQGVAYLKSVHPSPFRISLYVNRDNPAVGFYKHLGFFELDTRDHHIGNGYYMNDYIMALDIE